MRHGFPAVLADHGARLLAGLPLLCGIAVVEDQHERTALVEVLRPDEFFTREPELLERARDLLPRLPFAHLDVLVIDRLGKDVSGTGMDTNVTGRASFWGGASGRRSRASPGSSCAASRRPLTATPAASAWPTSPPPGAPRRSTGRRPT